TEWFQGSGRGFAMGVYATGPAIGGTLSLTLTHSVLLPWLGDWRRVMLLWAGVAVVSGIAWFVVTSLPKFREAETKRRSHGGALPQLSTMRELVALPDVRLILALATGTFLIAHGVGSWLPSLLQARGLSTTEAGYWAAIPAVVGVVSALVVPRLAIPRRRRRLLFLLVATSACSTLLFQLAARPSLLAGLVLQGAAATVLTPILVLTLLELPGVGEKRAGTASGLFFSAAQIGGVVGPMGLGVFYDLSGGFALGLGAFTLIALAILAGITRLARTEA
ncbi:MFS transporter, partial [Myxococcota bacterium]|nr:MFS transporter [Myxococcota bacterium]